MSLDKIEARDAAAAAAQPRLATTVTFASCPHGNVFIRLHGADGSIFAAAVLEPAVALEASASFDEAIEHVLTGRTFGTASVN